MIGVWEKIILYFVPTALEKIHNSLFYKHIVPMGLLNFPT